MKKRNKFFFNSIALTIIAIFVLSCKNDDTVDNTTIVLNQLILHFTSKAESPETIEIKGTTNWNAVEEIDWIIVEKQDNKLVVTAQPSRSLTNREGIITVVDNANPSNKAEIQVMQDHGTPKKYDLPLGGIPVEHLSPNGRYAAGEFDINGIVFDIYQIADDTYEPALYSTENTDLVSDNSFSLRGVDDNGKPFAKKVTADGSTTVKFEKGDGYFYTPYLIKNGVSTPLDFPDSYITGNSYKGVYADLISADGKYLTGRINADGSTWISCKWVLNGTNYEFGEIAPDMVNYDENNFKFTQYPCPQEVTGLSVMGEYSCGVIRIPQSGSFLNPFPAKYMPYIYKMSDDSLTVPDGEEDSRASFVTDDGTLFCASPYSFPIGDDRVPYVYEDGTKLSFSEWVNSTYGLTVEDKGVVSAVAKDYSVIVWFTNETSGFVNHFIVVEP
ncbi:MAG: BACON domain-containing protein [Prevotellaceae bacterium]|jgi:hypothetical protein|nr:BACON domain-containing protein [Prevotellaceae bacterium]